MTGSATTPSDTPGPAPLSRAELLGGLAGRRVSTALYAVETRTAFLARQDRHVAAPAICEGVAAQHERAFLSALAAGRDLPAEVTAAAVERYAPQWAHLAPGDPEGRAELAARLGAKYRFRERDVPRLRAVLGLDTEPVRAAFHARHHRGLDTVYVTDPTRTERIRWWRARVARRLAELPPFWAAFGLTLTETIGAGTLALPIALAGVGPLPGVALIVALGLVNVLTVVAVAESFTRSGEVRWGGAYFARLVRELLGPAATVVFTAGLTVFCMVALLAYFVGFATTLAAGTGLGAPVWAAVLFAAVLLLLRRGGIDATVASALVVGAVNIGAILLLSVLALGRADPAFLGHARLAVDAGTLGLVFGVVLFAFFGHTSVANCARVVLHRDPGGRALVRGAALATVTAVAVYALWVVAVGGAVPPQRLAAEPGTALVPLTEVVGLPALVVGTVFAVLAMGMAAVHFSWGLYNQARELGRDSTWLGLLPVAAVFALVEVLLLTGNESFTGQIGLIGTATLPLLAGVFPVLMLVVARRRGEIVPRSRPAWLGGAAVTAALYLLFLGALAVHGLVIWQHPAERALAFAVLAVVVATTVVVVREGRLAPAVAVEVRRETETGRVGVHLTGAGEPLAAAVATRRGTDRWSGTAPDGLLELAADAEVTIAVPAAARGRAPRVLRVRLHSVDPARRSEPLRARVELDGTALEVVAGRATAPLAPGPHEVRVVPDAVVADAAVPTGRRP